MKSTSKKLKRIYCKDTKEKDHIIFFTCAVLLPHRGLGLNKIDVFCVINRLRLTQKMKIKEKITSKILYLSI